MVVRHCILLPYNTLHKEPLASLSKVHWNRVDREPPMGEIHLSCQLLQRPTKWASSHTGTWQGAQLLFKHTDSDTKVSCDPCYNMHMWCRNPMNIIQNPHWRWCNDNQLAAKFCNSNLLWWLNSSIKTCSPGECQTRSAWCRDLSMSTLLQNYLSHKLL